MKLSICKLSTGETIIGEYLGQSGDYHLFDYPYTMNQHPAQTESGGFSEMLLMFPYIYKFKNSGQVRIKADHVISSIDEVNDTFEKFYKANFVKQTLHDLKQAGIIEELYSNRQPKQTQVLH